MDYSKEEQSDGVKKLNISLKQEFTSSLINWTKYPRGNSHCLILMVFQDKGQIVMLRYTAYQFKTRFCTFSDSMDYKYLCFLHWFL